MLVLVAVRFLKKDDRS